MRKFDTKMHLWSILNLMEVLCDSWDILSAMKAGSKSASVTLSHVGAF